MRRSTFVTLGLAAFGCILGTFVLRGTTRLVIGDRASLVLVTPLAVASLVLVVLLVVLAAGELTGIAPLVDDLGEEDREAP